MSASAEAIGRGGPLEALVARLSECQAVRDDLRTQLANPREAPTQRSLAGLEQEIRAKLADWRTLLTQNVDEAREVLRLLLGRAVQVHAGD